MQWDKQLQLIDYYHDSSAINGMVFLLKTLCRAQVSYFPRNCLWPISSFKTFVEVYRPISSLFFRHVSIKFIEHLIVAMFFKWPFAYCYFIKLLK